MFTHVNLKYVLLLFLIYIVCFYFCRLGVSKRVEPFESITIPNNLQSKKLFLWDFDKTITKERTLGSQLIRTNKETIDNIADPEFF